MPNMSQVFQSPERKAKRYRLKATGEAGIGVSDNGSRNVGRLASIGPDYNVRMIDLFFESTGEIRTYRADFVEELRD